jgi:tetrahydromethanopterin S-methyltransferase subunit D
MNITKYTINKRDGRLYFSGVDIITSSAHIKKEPLKKDSFKKYIDN